MISKKSTLLSVLLILILVSLDKKINIKNPLFIKFLEKYTENEFYIKDNDKCNLLDPIYVMSQRFKKYPINFCRNNFSKHICFQSSKYDYYNHLYRFPYGVICLMENVIIDTSKSKQTNLTYKGPIDKIARGSPILFKGFFEIKCKENYIPLNYSKLYVNYFDSWNYTNDYKNNEFEELAPGKTIFFISRNEDSPNLFHGFSEIINCLSVIYLFDLNPEDIQIVFLESMNLNEEPLYDFYTNIISKVNEPIYIRNLNNKYHISSAIHIPIGADSPLFMMIDSPECKYSTITYKIVNKLINKYLNITKYNDLFKSDNEIFYYPKLSIKSKFSNISFIKNVTIQWRKVWPKGRINQKRLFGNGPELSDKLASVLPNNFLVRLVDTASLSITQQISIMKNTDYFIGIHGAGLSLSIFMANHSILHEILPYKRNKLLLLMSKLSGHKSYSDIIKSKIEIRDNNEYIYFDDTTFLNCILKRMKQNNII